MLYCEFIFVLDLFFHHKGPKMPQNEKYMILIEKGDIDFSNSFWVLQLPHGLLRGLSKMDIVIVNGFLALIFYPCPLLPLIGHLSQN